MSQWPSTKARRVYAALIKIGWSLKRKSGSHRTLQRNGWPDFVFAFHDGEEIGPKMLARIAKHTGLKSGSAWAKNADALRPLQLTILPLQLLEPITVRRG